MTLDELGRAAATGMPPEVEIHALDPMLYVVFLADADGRHPLQDAVGKVKQFPSRYAATACLQRTGLARATFVHRTAYDEMIGVPSATGSAEFREVIDLQRR